MAKTAAERQRESRARKRDIHVTKPERVMSRYPCRLDYHLNPDDYITRREPGRLNWGPWLNTAQLEQAGLKANRVSIPGDWDYAGAGSALMQDIGKVNAITTAAQDKYTGMRTGDTV